MSKITKKELQRAIQRQESRIDGLVGLLAKKGYYDKEPEPQLKQLDQSVFDGEPEQIKWAVVTNEGAVLKFELEPVVKDGLWHWTHSNGCRQHSLIGQYDASNWQNSLIERDDIAKELAEVDLSIELTGSDLCRAMFERGDNYIMCVVGTIKEVVIIDTFQDGYFYSKGVRYLNPKPINNQGEPLTAAEAGL